MRFLDAVPDLEHLTAPELRKYIEGQGWGGSQQWIALCAIRGFVRWKFGEMHPALLLRMKRERAGPQRTLKADQVARLLESFETLTTKGKRDLAMCTLMLDTGLRLAEVCRLQLQHLDLADRSLSVLIKGGRWGDAVFSTYTASWIQEWLGLRAEIVKPGVRQVFVSLQSGDGLSRDYVRVLVRRWGERVGIKLSPHDLRRTFATLATRNGAPTRVVQVAGRWSSIDMVERYTRALEAEDFEQYSPVARIMGR